MLAKLLATSTKALYIVYMNFGEMLFIHKEADSLPIITSSDEPNVKNSIPRT